MASRSPFSGKSGRAFGGSALPPTFSKGEFALFHEYVGKAKRRQNPPWLRFTRLFTLRTAERPPKARPDGG